LTIKQLILMETAASLESLHDHKQRRRINHRVEECGYIPDRMPAATSDGLWVVNKKRCVIYARDDVPLAQQEAAACKLSGLSSAVRGRTGILTNLGKGRGGRACRAGPTLTDMKGDGCRTAAGPQQSAAGERIANRTRRRIERRVGFAPLFGTKFRQLRHLLADQVLADQAARMINVRD
jgi:hypothetical protein